MGSTWLLRGAHSNLAITDGRITGEPGGPSAHEQPEIDTTGLTVAPGFVDCQINGGFGIDVAANPIEMWELGRRLPETGVTAFLPTLVTGPEVAIEKALAALADRPAGYAGAEPLGLHLEGPFLNPTYKGAHDPAHLATPSLERIEGWSRANGVALVTLAPELPGALPVVDELVRRGVTVSAGHTGASHAEALVAAERGVSMVTHLFNAMSPLHHRNVALAAAALGRSAPLTAGVIVDGVHVAPEMVDLAWRCLGPERLVLVTDAVAPMQADTGSVPDDGRVGTLSGQAVEIVDGGPRYPDGTLAGSILTMVEAVRNLMTYTSASLDEAVAAASTTPARMIGAADRGSLSEGSVADVVLLTEACEVAITLVRGEVAYVDPAQAWRLDHRAA